MMVAIDTSGPMSGLALMSADGTLLAEQSWFSERRHSEQVLAQLDALCRLVEITPTQITRVAVAIGPGSWSGIRVGISIAKGIAIANTASVVGVNTLDVLAWPMRNQAPITACISLGRGRLATANYPEHSWDPGSISPINQSINQLMIDAEHILVYDPQSASIVSAALMHHTRHHNAWPYPRILAELGLGAFRTYPHGHPIIEPIYLGEPVQFKT